MKRYAVSLSVVLVLLATVVLPGSNASAAKGPEPGCPVSWSPSEISIAISPGGSWEIDLILTSKKDFANISLFITPELQPFVSIAPQSFLTITSNTPTTVHIDVTVPIDAMPGSSYEGTVHIKAGHRTYPQTLKVLVHTAAPLETVTEETYNGTLALDVEASEIFDELQSSLGPDAARRAVVEWLLGQDEILDAGTSDDGSIWIAYKIGLDAILPTTPPGTLGSGISSPGYQITQDSLQLMSGCVHPGAKSAILLWPLCSDPAYQPKDGPNWTERMAQISDMLAATGYDVTCVRDAEVTVDLLKLLYQYGVVDFFTHGSKFMSSQVMLATGEEASYDSFVAHLDDVTSHRLARRSVVEGTWMIRPSFIEYYAAQPYPSSLVDVSACYSLANHTMANAFLENGAYVYCGWSKETTCILNQGLYEDLTQGKSLGETYIEWVDKGWTTCNNSATWSYYPCEHGDLCLNASAVVHFPDPNLEAAIREAIGKPTGDIYASDLEELTSLSAYSRNIFNLTGLERCTSLTDLDLYHNQISDISPLANLTSLRSLYLTHNQISDISLLANLTSLTCLDLDSNQIGDISPLTNLTSLNILRLYDNQISDISPLANLTSLTSLKLGNNQISDISPLANLTSLTSLWAYYNQISDISPLANLTSLWDLLLGYNQISDISPLANLTNLQILSLYDNQISDISPLANLASMNLLTLCHNQISDISPLSNLTSLTSLWVRYNQISNISPLANLTNLTSLRLCHNQISDTSSLANLTSLRSLYLRYNQISDIEPLVNNSGLSEGDDVDLRNNPLSDTSINTYIPQLEARGVSVEY